jgi:alkylation response protein AidB-like acyl-CoA dehydrogenase
VDFSLTPELADLQQRVRAFIAEEIIPLESDPRRTVDGPTPELRQEMTARARRAGLLSPHVAREYGGMALSHVARAIVFEEAGYSLLGPLALNVSAPDEGNMHLLEAVARPEHKERWLRPLAAAQTRSCFCMTEPAPGAGSDPSMLATTAKRDGDDYIIDGTKWFITGADGAAFAIIMARIEDAGPTMFLSDMSAPGIAIERAMGSLDTGFPGGHSVVRFAGLRVPAENILGELGKGYQYAQVRLSPARLTHCMRWLGAVRRAHDIAVEYARERTAFGRPIGEHEGVGFMLADNEMDMHVARLTIWHCAWALDQGGLGLHESSRAKVIVSEAVWRVIDRCVQVLGGRGVTDETIVAKIFADLRAFRIYDGPSEVHRFSIARRILRGKA